MTKANNKDIADLIGVGIGPFNLSLAALLSSVKTMNGFFFDQKDNFVWHPGMLLPDAEIQVSYLKDLVTLVDPTNPYSFIAYLAKHKRLYRFINSKFKNVLRMEFNGYLNWVSRSLPNLFFQEQVEDIYFDKANFVMKTSKRNIKTKHLVLGNGLTPYIPPCAKTHLSSAVFHSKDFLSQAKNWSGKRMAVIGGGQSGAEIIHHILSNSTQLPLTLTWVTKRNQFLPIDDSPFVNEFFTPNYSDYFFQLPEEKKSSLLQEQVLASDGISLHLLEAIYQKLYILECIDNRGKFFHFLPNHQLVNISIDHATHKLTLDALKTTQKKIIPADIIILCTGYRWELPSYLSSLSDRIQLDNGQFCVNHDFSILWDGPKKNRIYVQNAARHTHGVADPNLSLMSWRSAKIINSIAESQIYDIDDESAAIDWPCILSNKNEEWKYVSNA